MGRTQGPIVDSVPSPHVTGTDQMAFPPMSPLAQTELISVAPDQLPCACPHVVCGSASGSRQKISLSLHTFSSPSDPWEAPPMTPPGMASCPSAWMTTASSCWQPQGTGNAVQGQAWARSFPFPFPSLFLLSVRKNLLTRILTQSTAGMVQKSSREPQ